MSNRDRLSAVSDFGTAVSRTNATFVIVPTPSLPSGEFSLEYVESAMESIGRALRNKDDYHLVTLMSTVMPGSMDETVRPILERASGKVCGKEFGLCYNPEFIALGEVIKGLLEPDFVLIGESDDHAGSVLAQIQREVCNNSPPMERMSFINAELAKISVNSFVTMKMSFANTLAEICERTRGADVDKITTAIGKDRRIGSAYLKGALGYGGPCFPRDNVAFAGHAKKVGAQAILSLSTHEVNQCQVRRIVKLTENEGIHPPSKVGILGLTYKPETNITEASQALMLAQELMQRGFEVYAYDPALSGKDFPRHQMLKMQNSAEDCLAKSDVCILATPWKEFSKIEKAWFAGKTIIDCWRILDASAIQNASRYIAIGKNLSERLTVVA